MSQHDKAWFAEYREKNRLWLRVYAKRWHHKTKGKRYQYLKDYRKDNLEHIRQLTKENSQKRRLKILGLFGEIRCSACGYDKDWRALHIDHVNSNGSSERKSVSHSWNLKFWTQAVELRRSYYQILCANCNWIKRYDKNELWRKKCLP